MDIYQESTQLHKRLGGKLEIIAKYDIKDQHDLSMVYTPGVAQVCRDIAEDESKAYELTIKRNTVAIVSDGSAVLGLGNIGAKGAIPVMEGKAMLFKAYADIDAFPICVSTQNSFEIINLVKNISPVFAGVNSDGRPSGKLQSPVCATLEGRSSLFCLFLSNRYFSIYQPRSNRSGDAAHRWFVDPSPQSRSCTENLLHKYRL